LSPPFLTGGVQVKYSEEFIEQALVKVHSRGGRTIASVAEELGVKFETVKKWLKVHRIVRTDVVERERRPHEWRREEQLGALLETHALNDEELNAWCRERGLFPHHLEEWRAAFCANDTARSKAPSTLSLSKENAKLKKELVRKEKALAEAAALLVLQKKFQALWADEEE
jgi:transposase-like protein